MRENKMPTLTRTQKLATPAIRRSNRSHQPKSPVLVLETKIPISNPAPHIHTTSPPKHAAPYIQKLTLDLFPGDSSPVAPSFGSRLDGDSHCQRPSSPPPRRPPLLSLLRLEGQDAAALAGTAGPALPLPARAGRASWLATCRRCRPWPSGRAAATAVAWVGKPCSPRAGLGLDPVPIRVVSVRSAPCCASSPLNGEIRRRFLLMNVYGSSVRCTINCGSRVRVGQQSLSCLLHFSFL